MLWYIVFDYITKWNLSRTDSFSANVVPLQTTFSVSVDAMWLKKGHFDVTGESTERVVEEMGFLQNGLSLVLSENWKKLREKIKFVEHSLLFDFVQIVRFRGFIYLLFIFTVFHCIVIRSTRQITWDL